MAKTMKTWNGYEIVDDAARKDIAGLKEEIANNLTWEKIKDKPFEGFNISWDGDIVNRIEIEKAYLVSTDVLTVEDFANGVIMTLISRYGEGEIKEIEISIDDIIDMNGMLLDNYGMISIIPYDNFVVNTEWGDFTIPKKGVYFKNLINDAAHAYDLYEPYVSNLRSKNFSPLDEKYIPDTIARKDDLIGGAIIDVVELPTENIREDCFYRLLSAEHVCGTSILTSSDGYYCYCVNALPEFAEVVTDAEMSFFKFYYNTEDNGVYGYVDDALASAFGFPSSGWIDYGTLCAFTGETYNGVITHIDDAKDDASWRVLLSHSLHIYKDGWKELPYAYESAPEFDIKWDGEIGDKFALDLTSLGNPGYYLVKVSDDVFNIDELLGAVYTQNDNPSEFIISEDIIDTEIYPGVITIAGGALAIVNDSDTLNAALGTPSGYITNGTYFVYFAGDESSDPFWTNCLVGKKKITKIDSKFIDVDTDALDNLATVATTGSYNDLADKPTIYTDVIRYSVSQSLSSTNKSRARANIDVYSKSEVDTKIANNTGGVSESQVQSMIAEAIGTAIGGSY